MTKTQLIENAAKKAELSKKAVAEAYDALYAALIEAIENGESVQIFGFGTFAVKTRAARKGINPQTKQTIEIPASKYVAFTAAKSLKDKVN